MIYNLPKGKNTEGFSKSGDWFLNQREKDTRVIASANSEKGLHIHWGNQRKYSQEYSLSPHNLEDKLEMSRFLHCTNILQSSNNPIELLLNLNRLRMTEHFFALRILLQLESLDLDFPDGAVPYSRLVLTDLTKELLSQRIPAKNQDIFVTPKESFSIKKGIAEIEIELNNSAELNIYADFDYTQYKKLAWVGKGSAEFHSKTSNPIDFTDTTVPCLHDFWNFLFKIIQGTDFEENFIRPKEILNNPNLLQSIFNHKILDLLGALNIGKDFLSANIYMKKGSHESHLLMREKLQEVGVRSI